MKKQIICGIYKITSPSGRIYIGESKDIYNRFLQYQNLQNCKSQHKLYRSLKKYRFENHTFKIIEECFLGDLLCRERFWQDRYDVLNGGLNCRLSNCGDTKGIMSEETKQKLSDAHKQLRLKGKGNPPPPPMKGVNNPMFGRKHSEETIDKMKKNKISLKGELHYNSSIFLHPETGVFYFSVREVSAVLGVSYNYVADRIYGKVKNNLSIIKV
jgi:group I intron endonuclease